MNHRAGPGPTEAEASKDLLPWGPGKGGAVCSLSKPDVFRKPMGLIFLFCLLFVCLFSFESLAQVSFDSISGQG